MSSPSVCSRWLSQASCVAVLALVPGCAGPGGPVMVMAPQPTSMQAVDRSQASPAFWPQPAGTAAYQPSSTCGQCHGRIVEQHAR
jgi:hypothetical protein